MVALLCTLSSISISFLRYGRHACMQYSKWGLNIVLYSGIISSFSLYTIFRLINPRIWFPFAAAILYCSDTFTSHSPKSFSSTVVFSTVPHTVCCASSFHVLYRGTSQRNWDGIWLNRSAGEVMCKSALSSPMDWILRYIKTYLFFFYLTLPKIKHHLPLHRPFGKLIQIIL